MNQYFKIFTLLSVLVLSACGGSSSSGSSSSGGSKPTVAALPSLTIESVKTFNFSWTDVSDATYYQLLENADGSSGFTQVGSDIAAGEESYDHIVPLYARTNASYILASCNDDGCTDSSTVTVTDNLTDAIGYFKASNTGSDYFGRSVSLSEDGNTLAIGANTEDSAATGVDGDQTDNSANYAGAVYVFTYDGSTWTQEAYLKASNTGESDYFGQALSLSDDGNTLAVGATSEASNATGVDGVQTNNSATDAGAVYVFTRSGTTWSQEAYLKASNAEEDDYFGQALSLSDDGNTLAVGAYREDGNATGVDGDQTANSASEAGAVYVFTRSGSTWSQQAYLKASNANADDYFGVAVSLSDDGNTLAVGAYREESAATGIDGDQTDDSASDAGAVYVFSYDGTTWSQQAYIKSSNSEASDYFGYMISLSGDGNTLAVGAYGEDSVATGIDGDQTGNTASDAGAAYVFTRSGAIWSQETYIKASNAGASDYFGYSISLSDDGNTLAVGAYKEDSSATGIDGDQTDNSAGSSGAMYVFTRGGTIWSQKAYLKASYTEGADYFGRSSVSLSGDGNTLAVGAYYEDSDATGIDGDQTNNNLSQAGAVYLY